ncbi:MAG: ABC transporter substrate-binding protein [Betaproteobacteria bacterium]|nr:MAG: ABC transporter substrate-binding protein [Betaproteobacteria bacterium]
MRLLIEGARHRLQRAAAVLCVVAAFGLPVAASAEVKEVQIARGFAIPHLPIMIMEHDKLLEKHALAAGLGDIRVTYSTIGGGSVMNDSLISGALSFGVGGPPPMLTLWDKTRSGIRVKGVCAEATMPLLLNTRNPNLKTVKDLTERDKIAVGAVKVSIQARLLQMAAAKAFGDAEFARFDALTVGMNSPDASAALRSGAGEVNTNFSLPPFQYAELKVPGIHTLVSSNDIMGGPHTFTMVYATSTFHDANPKTFQAFLAAIKEAIAIINRDKNGVARTYLQMTNSKEAVADIVAILDDPLVQFTMTPVGTMKFADFMYRIEALKNKPNSWQDYFFEEIQNLPGS